MGNLLVVDSNAMMSTWQELLRVRPFRSAVHDESFTIDGCPFVPGIALIDIDAFPTVAQGFALVESLRTRFRDARIIVLMTDPLVTAQRAYEAGASACLPKPLDYAVVLKLLDLMVRSQREEARSPVQSLPQARPLMRPVAVTATG